MNRHMKIVRCTVVTAIFSVLLSGCVSSMKSADLNKYKGATPDKLLSEQWYVTSLNPRLFVFETALFEEDQVRKMADDLSGLCKASGGMTTYSSLSQNAIHETREAILESHSRDKVRPTDHGHTIYDAAAAEQYFGHNMSHFNSNRFVDVSMKNYIQKSYFGRLDCSVKQGPSWRVDIVPGDVFTDSSEVVSLPIFVLTRNQ